MAHQETILTLTYDFLLYLIPVLSKYPRDQKACQFHKLASFSSARSAPLREDKINAHIVCF